MNKASAMLTATLFVVILNGCDQGSAQKPDFHAMRAHRVKAMSDGEIRAAHDRAKIALQKQNLAELERRRALEKAEIQRLTVAKKTADLCADPVYRARNGLDCTPVRAGLMAGDVVVYRPQPATLDTMFDIEIVGDCAIAKTAREAQERGCLP